MRVLVAIRPRFFQEVLAEALVDFPDLEVATELPVTSAILRATKEFRADCVLVTLDKVKELPPVCQSLLDGFPYLHVIGIGSVHNRHLSIWFDQGLRTKLVGTSLRCLVATIRKRDPHSEKVSLVSPQ